MQPIAKANLPAGYQAQAADTTPEFDAFEFELLRRRSPHDRLQIAAALMRGARELSLRSLRQTFQELSASAIAAKVVRVWLGDDVPPNLLSTGITMAWIQDSLGLAIQLHHLFDHTNIPYYVTGGLAAIAYGEPRTTRDADIVLAIAPTDIAPLVVALEADGFYVPGVEDVRTGRLSILQATHIETISRADLIVAGREERDLPSFQRRRAIEVKEQQSLFFASPEDVILSKLAWRQRSESEKQWRDVLGVMKVQGEKLDFVYLVRQAEVVGLWEALREAAIAAGVADLF